LSDLWTGTDNVELFQSNSHCTLMMVVNQLWWKSLVDIHTTAKRAAASWTSHSDDCSGRSIGNMLRNNEGIEGVIGYAVLGLLITRKRSWRCQTRATRKHAKIGPIRHWNKLQF